MEERRKRMCLICQMKLEITAKRCRGAFRFGSLTSVFFAIQHISAIARQQVDVLNTAVAAGMTGSVFGFFAGLFYANHARTLFMWLGANFFGQIEF